MKQNNFYKKTMPIQILLDYLCVIISFLAGYLFWWKYFRSDTHYLIENYFNTALIYGVVYVCIFWLCRLYEEALSFLNVEQLRRLIRAWVIGSGALFSLGFLYKEMAFSRLSFVFAAVILLIVMLLQRGVTFVMWRKLHKKGIGVHKAVIIGAGDTAVNVFNIFANTPWLGIVPIGFIDDIKKEVVGKDNRIYPVIGELSSLKKILELHKIDQVIIIDDKLKKEQFFSVITLCEQLGIKVKVVPHFYNAVVQRLEVESLSGIPIFSVNSPKSRWLYNKIKYCMDFFISVFILFVSFPLLFIIAIAVKLTSKGPIFFTQERVGMDGKLFNIYKIRTMYVHANKYEKCPNTLEDSRIIPIGKFLRKTSLDELPQFLNVMKGEMGLVGPRPEMPFIVESYNDVQRQRLKVRPGITGLWQISHKRGSLIHENIDFDLYYIENQSLTLDLAILMSTVVSVFKGIGAC